MIHVYKWLTHDDNLVKVLENQTGFYS
jgi:hypothetical protein